MNENTKTLTVVGAAVAVMLLVWVTSPTTTTKDTRDQRGQLLVEEFDPQTAASLDIVEFDEDTATVRPFNVAKTAVKGKGKTRWSIPSHENYPTDAKDQLADVAAGLMNLKILDVASESPGDHALYGVLDPDPKVRKVGDTGVGTRVTIKDQGNKDLLALIVGKAVPDKPELRYVRRVGSDAVYVVAAKTDKISTKFENWIEKDLLKLSTWDIKQFWVRDYSVDQLNMALIQRGEMTLEYNDTGDPKWKMLKDEKFRRGEWVPVKMADDEELNATKLDEIKNALGDLKIVDVTRKPEGLSADLKAAGDFAKNREAVNSLANRGFFVAKVGDQVELFSNEGEVRCSMKDGVQYVLRFGEIVPDTTGSSSKDKEKEKGTEQEKKPKSTGLNRYLFVTTEFNGDIIPKPQLEPLPEEKKEAADGKKADGKKVKEKKAKAKKAKKDEQDPPEDKKADDKKAEEKPADDKKAEKDDDAKDDKKSGEKTAADAERERIEKENKRKQDEYDEKVKKGKDRVTELNGRFADWYYVISDEVYHKIHLTRADIIKKKEKPKEEDKEKAKDSGKEKAAAEAGQDKEKATSEGDKPAQGKTDKPADEKTDKPADEKTDKPADEEKPAGQSDQPKKEQPAGKE